MEQPLEAQRQEVAEVRKGAAEMQARSFVLMDESGTDRARLLRGKRRAGVVALYDENSSVRALLDVRKDAPGLRRRDENGKLIWSAL